MKTSGYDWETIYTLDRTYSDGGVATERREQWGASSNGAYADFTRTLLDNSWDAQGRADRLLQRTWYFEGGGAQGNYALWSSTVFGYREGGYSANTWSAAHGSGQPPIATPALTRVQDFVVDSRGTVINTRDDWVQLGEDKNIAVAFHPNGVEAS